MNKVLWEKAGEIVSKLTLKEKIGQLNQEMYVYNNPESIEKVKQRIKNGEVGSVIIAGSSTAGTIDKSFIPVDLLDEFQQIAVEQSNAKIPLIFGRDVIHGHRVVLPIPLGLCSSFNPEVITEGYEFVAKEAASEGINWTFAPMMDISRDARWGRCAEGIGEDPYLGEKVAAAIVKGFQGDDYSKDDKIAACAKHYIGYGAAEGGRDYAKAEISDYTLRNYYLKPFRSAVNAGVATVMNCFNEVSGVSSSASRYLLYDLLKDELGFEGYVVSDWGTVEQTVDQSVAKDREDAARICVNAGLDMEMVSRCYIENLEKLVNDGKVDIKTIEESAQRIIYIKLMSGMFEKPYSRKLDIDYDKHVEIAKKCSDEAMILLKNENNTLPLSKDKKIFVCGPMLHEKRSLHGTWCSDGDVNYTKSFYEVMNKEFDEILGPRSPYLPDSGMTMVRRGYEAIVMFLGESYESSGETGCLANVDFPKEQLEFIKRMKTYGLPLIGVMAFGRPIGLEEAERYFDAILYTWHSGSSTAQSAVDILLGKVNPSGRVPMSFHRVTGQLPLYYNHPAGPRFVNGYHYENGIDGYNYLDVPCQPMYEFGYGLSYTKFEYSNVKVDKTQISLEDLEKGDKFKVSVDVKNVGNYAGKETAQLYIRDIYASMTRPYREMKGFSKDFYEVSEQKTITFELSYEELAFYNAKAEFKVEKGEFEVYVGASCFADNKIMIEVV